MKKIAILGTAPSSLHLIPFGDTSWEIWGCSPGLFPHAKRVDAWFEIHRFEPNKSWFSPEYIAFLAKLKCPVYTIAPIQGIPGSTPYPVDSVVRANLGAVVNGKTGKARVLRFHVADFSSTIAWMIAKAIFDGADEIGLWGVDMSAAEEWHFQRSGCQNLLHLAGQLGIKVTVPYESDLMRPPPLYGFSEIGPDFVKLRSRQAEITARLNDATIRAQQAQRESDHLRGALEQMDYQSKTWVGNPFHLSLISYEEVKPDGLRESPPPHEEPVNGTASASAPRTGLTANRLTDQEDSTQEWRDLENKLDGEAEPKRSAQLLNELSSAMQAETRVPESV